MLRQQAFNSHFVSPRRLKCASLASGSADVGPGGSCMSSWQPTAARHFRIAAARASPDQTAHVSLRFDWPYASLRPSGLQPCRARKFGMPEPPSSTGSVIELEITKSIRESKRIQDFEDVVDEWGSSFNYIHTSAAFAKAAKLVEDRPTRAGGVATQLVRLWAQQFDRSDVQGLVNVLWASSKLQLKDPSLWSQTLRVFLQDVAGASFRQLTNVIYALAVISTANRGLVPGLSKEQVQEGMTSLVEQAYILITHPGLKDLLPQHIANILWSCARLQFNIKGHELAAFVKALSRSDMVEAATAQALANSIYALSELQKTYNLHLAINERLWGRILDTTVVDKVADGTDGYPQVVSNTLLALARLATGTKPFISQSLAQGCATRLLNGTVAANIGLWLPQDLSNAVYACAKLQVKHDAFLSAFMKAAPAFVSTANELWVTQVAWGCSTLDLPAPFMADLLSRTLQMVSNKHTPADDQAMSLVTSVVSSIVVLDMQEHAASVVELVSRLLVHQRLPTRLSRGHARRLWEVHTWLVDKHLLDGQGLSRCLTLDQLAFGRTAAKEYLSAAGDQWIHAGAIE